MAFRGRNIVSDCFSYTSPPPLYKQKLINKKKLFPKIFPTPYVLFYFFIHTWVVFEKQTTTRQAEKLNRARVSAYLAGDAVWAEFTEAERRRYSTQQSNDIKVFDATPSERTQQQDIYSQTETTTVSHFSFVTAFLFTQSLLTEVMTAALMRSSSE